MLLSELSKDLLWSIGLPPACTCDKDIVHNYCKYFYDIVFEKYADQKINLMEIGILNGASIVMWHRYFKNAQKIIGIDKGQPYLINPYFSRYLEICSNREVIETMNGDAYSEFFASSVKDDFDIIIDDGDHQIESQIKFLNLYLKKLKSNGILIIEDVFQPDVLLKNAPDPLKYHSEIIDLSHLPPCSGDSKLFVVTHI